MLIWPQRWSLSAAAALAHIGWPIPFGSGRIWKTIHKAGNAAAAVNHLDDVATWRASAAGAAADKKNNTATPSVTNCGAIGPTLIARPGAPAIRATRRPKQILRGRSLLNLNQSVCNDRDIDFGGMTKSRTTNPKRDRRFILQLREAAYASASLYLK